MSATAVGTSHLGEHRELLKTLKGDLRAREARAVAKTMRNFYSSRLEPEDVEAEKRVFSSRSYRELTHNLSKTHAALHKELKTLKKSTGKEDMHEESRLDIVQGLLKDNDERQDQALSDLERFIYDEESEVREQEMEKAFAEGEKH